MSIEKISLGAWANSGDAPLFSLPRLWLAIAKRRKLVLGMTLAGAIVSVAVACLLAPIYKATTTLLPPQQSQAGAAALLSQLGGAAGMVASAAGLKSSSDLYVAILKSRTISDELIKRFDLADRYGRVSAEEARIVLQQNTLISAGKDGLISIAVEDKDRSRSAQLANAYTEALINLTRVLAVTEASQRRLFFERQLELSKNQLAEAEVALKRGLSAHGVVSVDSDSRAMVETIARVRARISAKEVELNSMRSFVTNSNADFKRAQAELGSLHAELSNLENGSGIATAARPKEGGLANIQLLRDVKYYQMLYELLAKQYEMARLDEAREGSVIQVLDKAVAPDKKIKPRRALIVLTSTLLTLLAAISLAFLIEHRGRMLGALNGHKAT